MQPLIRTLTLVSVIALVVAPGLVAQPAAPVLTPDQQLAFLREARITGSRPAGKGVTGSLRLTLSDGTFTHDAGFQSVEMRATTEDIRKGRKRAGELQFADSYMYNIAAYEIARLLDLDHMMPATVERRYRGQLGSLTWWVDDVLMDEEGRDKQNAQPPDAIAFQRQRQRMFVFAELVHDVDRNKGNILYTRDWRVIMIDFTRAFRLQRELRNPDILQTCDRQLYERLQRLTRDAVQRAVKHQLTGGEISALMARRQLIVDRYAGLIKVRGEGTVLY